jgi:hypothetical protein
LKAPAPVGLGHVKPPWRVNGFVNQTLRNEQEGVENAAMIRGSVSIRSVSAMPVVACALNPQDESSSSSLTSTNVWVPTSFQLHTRAVLFGSRCTGFPASGRSRCRVRPRVGVAAVFGGWLDFVKSADYLEFLAANGYPLARRASNHR